MVISTDFKNKRKLNSLQEGIVEAEYNYKSKEKRAEVQFPITK